MHATTQHVQYPWATCFLTDILICHLEDCLKNDSVLDYPDLFRDTEGVEIPHDPKSFLRDGSNWVPLSVLRTLLAKCETASGKKDFAYQAALAYFGPLKHHARSLFEIIARILNDVRAVIVFANQWGVVQTNYLKLQSFEKSPTRPEVFILAHFDEKAKPAIGTTYLLLGLCEGFPRLYDFVHDVACVEELSQLRLEDIVLEFPDYRVEKAGNRLRICEHGSRKMVTEALRIPLEREVVPFPDPLSLRLAQSWVVAPRDGRLEVLRTAEESTLAAASDLVWAYRIDTPGILRHGDLSYSLKEGQVYNAPYHCLRLTWKEGSRKETSAASLRRDISEILFEHLDQIKQTQIRMVQSEMERRRLSAENLRLRREIERESSFAGILGESGKMQELFGVIRSISETDVTVLVRGETGTGKELIARAIHFNGPRKERPFVSINCGALAETLLESELFGHEKGAFTGAISQKKGIFELSDGGTLFLDEIGEVSHNTQVRLLRVLQEGELQRLGGKDLIKVDVRIIAATNENLEELVESGRFRQDLYFRLNVFPVAVPPLRERIEDIPLLVAHFIEKHKERFRKNISGVDGQTMAALMAHSWHGNVRELENIVQRMMVLCKGGTIDAQCLPPEIRGGIEEARERPKNLKGISRESAGIVEKKAIQDALSKTGGNVTRAAKLLGVSRATLQNKMKLYDLRSRPG